MPVPVRPARPHVDRLNRRRRAFLEFDPLEARQLLSVVSWASDSSGSWNDASKWSTGKVPEA
ncbi:MAG: hypothetical protein JWN86_2584 [Planctomycetota bacterium]|nr:hypothetical protein [Planctomycetota bacterium]